MCVEELNSTRKGFVKDFRQRSLAAVSSNFAEVSARLKQVFRPRFGADSVLFGCFSQCFERPGRWMFISDPRVEGVGASRCVCFLES